MINPKELQKIIDNEYKFDIPIEIIKLIIHTKFIVDSIEEKYPKLKYCDQTIDDYVYHYSPLCSFICSKYLVLRSHVYEIYISNCQRSTLADYSLYVKISCYFSAHHLYSIDLTNLKKYTNGKNIQITDNQDNIIDLPKYVMNEEKGLLEKFEIGPLISEIRLHGDFDLGRQFSELCQISCMIYDIILGNVNSSCSEHLNKLLHI